MTFLIVYSITSMCTGPFNADRAGRDGLLAFGEEHSKCDAHSPASGDGAQVRQPVFHGVILPSLQYNFPFCALPVSRIIAKLHKLCALLL